MAKQDYKPSDRVPVSGVYQVRHDGHREEHEATLLAGEMFPACSGCQDKVRFVLKHRAVGIREGTDFRHR